MVVKIIKTNKNNKNDHPVTKKDLIEVLDIKFTEYDKKMDIKFDQKFTEYDKKMDTRFTEYDKKMDIKLGNFADDILLPAIDDIIDQKLDDKLDKFRVNERDYLNKQLFKLEGNLRSEIQEQRKTEHKFIKKFVKAAKNTSCFRQKDIIDLSSFANNLNIQKYAVKT